MEGLIILCLVIATIALGYRALELQGKLYAKTQTVAMQTKSIRNLENQIHALNVSHKNAQHQAVAEVNQAVADSVSQITQRLKPVLAHLPPVPTGQEYVGKLSKSNLEDMSLTLGPIVSDGTGQLTHQTLESITELDKVARGLTLYIETVGIEAIALPIGLEGELAILRDLKEVIDHHDAALGEDSGAWGPIRDALIGKATARLINESKLEGGSVNPNEMMKLHMHYRAHIEGKATQAAPDFSLENTPVDDDFPFPEVYEDDYSEEPERPNGKKSRRKRS